ncbi:MAG: hypothetical protein RLZZ628_1507, partial [Bacteroidota bacterium]
MRINDTIRAAEIPICVTKVSGANGVFTGEGFGRLPWTGETKIKVKFTSVGINTDKRLITGNIETVYDPKWGNMLSIDGLLEGGQNVGSVRSGLAAADFTVGFGISSASNISCDTARGTITITGANGQTQTLPNVKLPTTIQDNQGRIYGVSANGTVTLLGQQQPLNMSATELNNLNADKGIVTFLSHGFYAFDAYNPVYGQDVLWRTKYEKIGDYGVANKASAPGKPDALKASIRLLDNSLRASDVIFMSSKGMKFVSRPMAEAGLYEIDIVGGPAGDAQEIYALHPKTGEVGKYWSLGKILVASYTPQKRKLVLVPVNGATTNAATIEQNLNTIYQPIGISWQVVADNNFEDNTWDVVSADGKMQIDETGFWSTQTLEMQLLKKHYATKRVVEANSLYLFVCTEANKPNVGGDMPRGKQFGYLFLNGNTQVGRTVAHEVGHGVFQLKHTFDSRYNFANTLLTDNLMNYGTGVQLSKYQWDLLHDPGIAIGIFDTDEDVQNYLIDAPDLNDRFKNSDAVSVSFLSRTGSIVSLPKDKILSLIFEYGSVKTNMEGSFVYEYDYLTGTLYGFTLKATDGNKMDYVFDNTTLQYKAGNQVYQDNFDFAQVNGFIYPVPCGSTYWLYKFPKNTLPRYSNTGQATIPTFDALFGANGFVPFSGNFPAMSDNIGKIRQDYGNHIKKACLYCADANTHATTKDFCEQPELIYQDKIAQLAVIYPEYQRSFTRSRLELDESSMDAMSFTVYQVHSHWGDILDARFRTGSLSSLEEKRLFLSSFKGYILAKLNESTTFWEQLDTVTASRIASFIEDESVWKMKTVDLNKRLLAIQKMVVNTGCFDPEENSVLKIMTSFEPGDYKTALNYLSQTIKIKTIYTKFNDFFGEDNFTRVIFALGNMIEATVYNETASKVATLTDPKIVSLDLDLFDNRRTSACEVFENNTVVFRNMQGDMYPAVGYDELIPVRFWSNFDILPPGQGRNYRKGEAIYMPAIVAAMLIQNGNKEVFSKQAWLAFDGLMLTVGVGQARMAWSAPGWARKLMLGADVLGSSLGIVNNIASDDYISPALKQKINLACLFLQAPEGIRGLAEVFGFVKSAQQEAADLLQAERQNANRQLSQKGEQGLDEFGKKVGTVPADEIRDIEQTAKNIIGLLPEEAAIVSKGLDEINDGRLYIVLHGEGSNFRIYHNGQELDFSHRSLARYLQSNPTFEGKDIVLLSCSNGTSAQNLANKLGGNRKVIAWEGEVKVFKNGRIEGAGTCKEFRAGPVVQNTTPPIGKPNMPAIGEFVALGANDWNVISQRLKNKLSSMQLDPNLSEADKLVNKISKRLEVAKDDGIEIADKINKGDFENITGYSDVLKKLSSEGYVPAAKHAFLKAEEA